MQERPAAINLVWLVMAVTGVVAAAYTARMDVLTDTVFDAAKDAVTFAIGLAGALALWLGIVRVAELAGLMRAIARRLRPLMRRLFPSIPADHPAMSAMVMNLSANAMGLGNAATPMGIKAMVELERLNPRPGTATDDMCLFLAINTSSVTLVPVTVMAIRASGGASAPAAILLPTLLATICSTTVAVLAAKLLARRSRARTPEPNPETSPAAADDPAPTEPEDPPAVAEVAPGPPPLSPPGLLGRGLAWILILALGAAIPVRLAGGDSPGELARELMSAWLVPLLLAGLLLHGYLRGVRVYEAVTDGARDGFRVAVRIIPFLVAIFVAIRMFRDSGAFDTVTAVLDPALAPVGVPSDVLPMALLRPLSGTGAQGVLSEIVSNAPDSFSAFLSSTMMGSTETTFYVLAVYFGAVGVRRTRHALPAALVADAAGIAAAVVFCHLLY